MKLDVGSEAPSFCAKDADGKEHCLDDYRGRWVVVYFYPKDMTSGCTLEAVEFTERKGEFAKMGAEIVGVSADSPERHQRFTEKNDLAITLLSDPEHQVLEPYGAWGEKKMYGKTSMGIIRSTVLIDPDGRVAHVWPKVRAAGHAEAVKEKLADIMGRS